MRDQGHLRRNALRTAAIAAVGGAIAGVASAQQVTFGLKDFPASAAGKLHGQRLRGARELLKGMSPLSLEGLSLLVDALVQQGILTTQEGQALKALIKLLYSVQAPKPLLDEIEKTIRGLGDRANDVLVALLEILRDSVQFAQEFLAGLPWSAITQVVAADAAGALSGADTGAKLGGRPGAVVGAVLGGASASINAAFATRR